MRAELPCQLKFLFVIVGVVVPIVLYFGLEDPVEVGARFVSPERARRRSDFFAFGASTMVCVLVTL